MLSVMLKTKNYKVHLTDEVQQFAAKAGLLLMASAAVLGMVELSDGREKVILTRPSAVFAPINNQIGQGTDTQRREKEEEASSHYVTYGTAIRTPSHTGKK